MYKDKQGRWRTQSLFRETITASARANGWTPEFTLKDVDPSGLPSLRRAFIRSEDPTGYTTAMESLGSWEHWVRLFENPQFKKELALWTEEQDVRIRSKAIKAIKDTAFTEGSKGTTAAKYLADANYKGNKRGRPSKQDIAREAKQQAGITEALAEDQERILHMVK